jgi:hypothetical protein
MLRRSFFCLMTLAVIGIRMQAQDTGDGAASKGYANFEGCCGRRKIQPDVKVGAYYKAAAGIFRGKLKLLNNKEIVIENDSKQMVSIRRSNKTKFLRGTLQIKPSDIDLETPVTIDATESASVSLLAVNVSVDSPPNQNRPEVGCPADIPLLRRCALTP